MTTEGLAVVYVRRRSDDSLRRIVAVADEYYALGISDFLVLDMSDDETALSALAATGDPLRYLTISNSLSQSDILEYGRNTTSAKTLILVDDVVSKTTNPTIETYGNVLVPRSAFFRRTLNRSRIATDLQLDARRGWLDQGQR
jgi:hypothetical protein